MKHFLYWRVLLIFSSTLWMLSGIAVLLKSMASEQTTVNIEWISSHIEIREFMTCGSEIRYFFHFSLSSSKVCRKMSNKLFFLLALFLVLFWLCIRNPFFAWLFFVTFSYCYNTVPWKLRYFIYLCLVLNV